MVKCDEYGCGILKEFVLPINLESFTAYGSSMEIASSAAGPHCTIHPEIKIYERNTMKQLRMLGIYWGHIRPQLRHCK